MSPLYAILPILLALAAGQVEEPGTVSDLDVIELCMVDPDNCPIDLAQLLRLPQFLLVCVKG